MHISSSSPVQPFFPPHQSSTVPPAAAGKEPPTHPLLFASSEMGNSQFLTQFKIKFALGFAVKCVDCRGATPKCFDA